MPDLSDIGIFISAVGGIIVIYEKMTKKREHFIVKYDSYNAEMDDRDSLYIVSKSFQPISIRDYGFIKENGELESIPWIGECACDGDNYDIVKLGVTEKMEYNQRVEFKCRTSEPIVGAFAMGATQNFPRLCFASNVRYIRRIQIRIKIILKYLSYM